MPRRSARKRSRRAAVESDKAEEEPQTAGSGEEEEVVEEPKPRAKRGRKNSAAKKAAVPKRRSTRRGRKSAADAVADDEEAAEDKDASDKGKDEAEVQPETEAPASTGRRGRRGRGRRPKVIEEPPAEDSKASKSSASSSRRGGRAPTKAQIEKENVSLKEEMAILKSQLSQIEATVAQSFAVPSLLEDQHLDEDRIAKWERDLDEDSEARKLLAADSSGLVDLSIDEQKFGEVLKGLQSHGERAEDWMQSLAALRQSVNEAQDTAATQVASGKKVYQASDKCVQLVNDHSNQLELMKDFGQDLLASREFLFTNYHSLEQLEKNTRETRESKNLELQKVEQSRAEALAEFKKGYNALCKLVSTENALRVARHKMEHNVASVKVFKDRFTDAIANFNEVRNQYQSYEDGAKESIPALEESVRSRWAAFEAKWWKWDCEDFYHWLAHSFEWFKYTLAATAKSHKQFVKTLRNEQVDGGSLDALGTVKLLAIGFSDVKHRSEISERLAALTTAFPKQIVEEMEEEEVVAAVPEAAAEPEQVEEKEEEEAAVVEAVVEEVVASEPGAVAEGEDVEMRDAAAEDAPAIEQPSLAEALPELGDML